MPRFWLGQWFPYFAAHWKHLGIFLKTYASWLPLPDIVVNWQGCPQMTLKCIEVWYPLAILPQLGVHQLDSGFLILYAWAKAPRLPFLKF